MMANGPKIRSMAEEYCTSKMASQSTMGNGRTIYIMDGEHFTHKMLTGINMKVNSKME